MKINLIILAVLIALTALWTVFAENWQPDKKITAPPAPNFYYQTVNGKKDALKNHKGKVILLHFWASWCPPCLVEFPQLMDLAAQEDFILLAVAVDDKKANISNFIKKLGKSVPGNMILAQDNHQVAEKLYGTVKLPESFLITPDMTIAKEIIGPQDHWNSDNWRKTIRSLNRE